MPFPAPGPVVAQARPRSVGLIAAMLAACLSVAAAAAAPFAITSYHYDRGLTGWNNNEPALNYSTVPGPSGGAGFQLQFSIPLDERVFAQPLVVPNIVVKGDPNPGSHDVVYISTYNNTLYAIDPTRGTVLAQRTLDPAGQEPCSTKAYPVGINGTPVIDLSAGVLYVIDQTAVGGKNVNYIHAISLGTLADVSPPRAIAASQTLTNGKTFGFSATNTRQRAALAEVNGNIYAAFAGACETFNKGGPPSRGWLLGWQARTLNPLPFAELTDRRAHSPDNFFFSSIWMSGSGLANDGQNLFFVTGNSDKSGTTYNSGANPSESVLKFSIASQAVKDFFTPYQVSQWDIADLDFGSGGVILPPGPPGAPPLAVAAGKSGTLYLMNANDLGGLTAGGPDRVLDAQPIGPCWCTPSSFQSGGSSYIVSSGGNTVGVWSINPNPTKLAPVASATGLPLSPYGLRGYFTTVSSNAGADPIIWTVTRAPASATPMTLYAFQALPPAGSTTLPLLFSAPVGAWAHSLNANITPVVANGRVYVAGDHRLTIFGLGPPR